MNKDVGNHLPVALIEWWEKLNDSVADWQLTFTDNVSSAKDDIGNGDWIASITSLLIANTSDSIRKRYCGLIDDVERAAGRLPADEEGRRQAMSHELRQLKDKWATSLTKAQDKFDSDLRLLNSERDDKAYCVASFAVRLDDSLWRCEADKAVVEKIDDALRLLEKSNGETQQ